MSSMFPGRRKHQRPVPIPDDHDPWGLRDNLSDDDLGSTPHTPRTTASRIMDTVRRFSSSTPKKRDRGHPEGGMYSTAAESRPPTSSNYNFYDRRDTRPTIEQIAMGLHISRTPHVLPPSSSLPSSPRRSVEQHRLHSQILTRPNAHMRRVSTSAIVLPPPPTRSSLKKSSRPQTAASSTLIPSPSDASLSTLTTQTSNVPSTPRSTQSVPEASFSRKLRLEMLALRLLPHRKESFSGTATPSSSDADSMSTGLAPRKSVRFSAGDDDASLENA